jgi:predicted  nucleic acid-binding Zn-ribbon protein
MSGIVADDEKNYLIALKKECEKRIRHLETQLRELTKRQKNFENSIDLLEDRLRTVTVDKKKEIKLEIMNIDRELREIEESRNRINEEIDRQRDEYQEKAKDLPDCLF